MDWNGPATCAIIRSRRRSHCTGGSLLGNPKSLAGSSMQCQCPQGPANNVAGPTGADKMDAAIGAILCDPCETI